MALNHRRRANARRVAKGPLPPKESFIKVGDGFIYMTWYADGAEVQMRGRQSKYLLLQGKIKKG